MGPFWHPLWSGWLMSVMSACRLADSADSLSVCGWASWEKHQTLLLRKFSDWIGFCDNYTVYKHCTNDPINMNMIKITAYLVLQFQSLSCQMHVDWCFLHRNLKTPVNSSVFSLSEKHAPHLNCYQYTKLKTSMIITRHTEWCWWLLWSLNYNYKYAAQHRAFLKQHFHMHILLWNSSSEVTSWQPWNTSFI